MFRLSTTELATELSLTKGRISQYVSAGKLDGCFQGDGRARRFDPGLVAAALGRGLDKGQMGGNGLGTRRAIRAIKASEITSPQNVQSSPPPRQDGPLKEEDPDRLELAKIQTAEENLRRIRRDNQLAEGQYVLAAEVERQVSGVVRREIGQVDAFLREGARAIADQMGVDFKTVRKTLIDLWRAHRARRADDIGTAGDAAGMSAAEAEADI